MSSKSYPDETEENVAFRTTSSASETESATEDNGVANVASFSSDFNAGMRRAMDRDPGLEARILANPERYTPACKGLERVNKEVR
ncbi:hypothetical protein B484DRAFT_397597 [Ochromonadaceae sp. CCMP2298]|nr:hypothetical protein B484DRAFT_397597 [Ochromonadaceae sp. CCMP2298]